MTDSLYMPDKPVILRCGRQNERKECHTYLQDAERKLAENVVFCEEDRVYGQLSQSEETDGG